MSDFYLELASMAKSLLAPTSSGGLGQGQIVLTRVIKGAPDPSAPWIPPADTAESETIRGAVRGVSKELIGTEVGGAVIVASDRQAITEVPKQPYTAGDILTVDGVPGHILSVTNIPAAGVVAAVKFIIRG